MDKRDKISIRMNGKETLIPREDEKAMEEVVTSQEEQAATAEVYEYEHSPQEKVIKPEAWKKHPYYKKKKRKKKLSSPVKNILIAVTTALILGLLLGFLLLRMFVGMTENDGASANSGLPLTEVTNNAGTTEGGSAGDQDTTVLPGTDAYVVQAGYFTSIEKAEEWSRNYIDNGYPTVVWEREGNVFLFTSLAPNQESANEKAAQLQQDGLDTYVKPWSVPKTENVNREVAKPLNGFADLFSSTVNEENNTEGWKQLADHLPENERFLSLKNDIHSFVSSNDSVQKDFLLLKVWKSYEDIVKK